MSNLILWAPRMAVDEVGGIRDPSKRLYAKPLQRDNSTQARNDGTQDDESSLLSGLPTGSTVARDLDTTASSGPRKFFNDKEVEEPESQAMTGGGPPNISELHNTTENAYGGGLYGSEETVTDDDRRSNKLVTEGSNNYSTSISRASDSQSVDGGAGSLSARREIETPVSSGHRDIDITGQSYIG